MSNGAPEYYDGVTTSADWICSSCERPRAQHACVGGFERRKFPFVGMLRVKNEGRWMAEVLESTLPLCYRVFVMDDHSTDDTAEICARYAGVIVLQSPFVGMNESRDKNWLYDQILAFCQPEWILCIDGDEVLEKRAPQIIRDTVSESVNSYKLQIAFMWNDRYQVRVDRIYRDFWRPSMFRPFLEIPGVPDSTTLAKEFRFKATPFGRVRGNNRPNLHCSSVPQRLIHGAKLMPVRLKHYGYMWRADRVRKLDFYTSIDWDNLAEDRYRHMTQGDFPERGELPESLKLISEGLMTEDSLEYMRKADPEMRLVHAGPIEVEPWNEDEAWPISEWARKEHA